MILFSRRPKCRKFFTYATRTLDLNGLSAGLQSADISGFDLRIGELKISPEFVRVSERLMEMDAQQYDLCQTIANISDRSERDQLFRQLAELKMEMLRMAANPGSYESSGDAQQLSKPASPVSALVARINELLMHNRIPEALEQAKKIPFSTDDVVLYNRKRETYVAGLDGQHLLDWIREMKALMNKYA